MSLGFLIGHSFRTSKPRSNCFRFFVRSPCLFQCATYQLFACPFPRRLAFHFLRTLRPSANSSPSWSSFAMSSNRQTKEIFSRWIKKLGITGTSTPPLKWMFGNATECLRQIRPLDTILVADTRANSEACSEIPYSTEQGIFAREQGICMREQGIFSVKTEIISG
jgi:hypothetical protein